MINIATIKEALTMLLPLLKALAPWLILGVIINSGYKRKKS